MTALTPLDLRTAQPLTAPVLWSGRPDAWAAAKRIWRLPWAAAWFALLAADGARMAVAAPPATLRPWDGELRLAVVAVVTLAGLAALAWLTAKTMLYEIDDRALTMRFGLALPATLVIPFAAIEAVSVKSHADGAGDVAIRLRPGRGVPYLKLMPHARPWRLRKAEPMLRGVRGAGVAAALLCRETARAHAERATG